MGEKFELPAELNIYAAVEIRDTLLAWVTEQVAAGTDRLEISAANVAEVDGAGLQILAALSNMGQSWQLVEASQVFTDACHTLGLNKWIDQRVLEAHKAGAPV